MNMEFNKVDATVLNLQPGDILFVTLKGYDYDESTLNSFRETIAPAFPNNKVAIICVGSEDSVDFSVVKPVETKGE